MDPVYEIELKILSILRSKRNWYKYRSVLQPGFFSSEETRQVFYIIEEFFKKHDKKKKLIISNMKLLLSKNIKDKDLKSTCLKLTKKLRKIKTTDNKVVEETIKDFAKRQLVKLAITECLTILDDPNPNLATIKEYIDRAMTLSTEGDEDMYSYFDDPEQRVDDEVHEKKIPTCIPKLDLELTGGMCPGELLVFLGPPGRGKTTALINMGVGGLIQGMTVLHITLEISARKIARRYDMRISGRTFKSIKKNPKRVVNPLAKLKKKGCDLIIKDWSMENPRVEDIYGMIISYQGRMKKKFDMIVIDYGDLIHPTKNYKDSRFGLEEVYTELRRLAVRLQVPVYTASQTNRESLNKNIVGMKDVAESFGKVKVADVVVGLCQTIEECEDSLVRLFIAKSRKKSGHPTIKLELDTERMYLGEMNGKAKYSNIGKLQKDW